MASSERDHSDDLSSLRSSPLVVAAEMGYGHLRPAMSLADELGTGVIRADVPPMADEEEVRIWRRSRNFYELASRWSQRSFVGPPFRRVMSAITAISDLYPYRDQSGTTRSVRMLSRWIEKGLGGGLVSRLEETGSPLLTTFYAPALAADRFGLDSVYCVVTDSDIHRIWAPRNPTESRIRYLVPSMRALRRLRAYGVPKGNIEFTGFPLPMELVGGSDAAVLRRNLVARIARLDPEGVFRKQWRRELADILGEVPEGPGSSAPLLTFAVGGAGAQAELARRILPGIRDDLDRGRLRLALVAGVRPDVEAKFESALRRFGLSDRIGAGISILREDTFEAYYRSFNHLLAGTDVLWTKPSELVFYAALGIPIVLSWPVGAQERANRRWLTEHGAGLRQWDPRYAGEWIAEWLKEGVLAAAAWSGFMSLPRQGTRRIVEAVRNDEGLEKDGGREEPTADGRQPTVGAGKEEGARESEG